MPWPQPPATRYPKRYTNVEHWRRQTGIAPLYTSAAFNPGSANGPYCPVLVTEPFTLRRLGVFNGSTLSGGNLASIGLFASSPVGAALFSAPQVKPVAWVDPFTRSGTSAWQWRAIAQGSVDLAPGLYFLGYHQNDTTSHVMRLSTEATTTFHSMIAGILQGVQFPVTSVPGWAASGGALDYPILGMDGESA